MVPLCCVAVSHYIDDCNDLNQSMHQGKDGGDTHKDDAVLKVMFLD